MKLGDTITIAGVEWKVRAFTAAEHQRFDELAAEHDLTAKAADLEVLQMLKHGTARETLFQSETKHLRIKLAKYLNAEGEIRENLSEAQRLAALQIATRIDANERLVQELRNAPKHEILTKEEELAASREAAVTAFMHEILKFEGPLIDFQASLSDEDALKLSELVRLGKLRAGLAARERLQRAALARLFDAKTRSKAGGLSA